jgi:hypothetical protein
MALPGCFNSSIAGPDDLPAYNPSYQEVSVK